jgi:hypothetical protein
MMFLGLYALVGCSDGEEFAPLLEAATLNDAAQLDVAKRVRDVEQAMLEVSEGQTTGTPAADTPPAREHHGVPLVPSVLVPVEDAPYALRVTRFGQAAPLHQPKEPVRDASPCGWYIERPALRYGSDLLLNRSTMGRSSPYLLLENGKPLVAHAQNGAHSARCAGAFRHAGARIEFSPNGYADAVTERVYTLAYDMRLPLARADGRELYWVYPGTEVVFNLEGTWPREGETPQLVVAAKRVGAYRGRPSYQVGWDKPKWLRGAAPVVRAEMPADSTALRFSINSPVDGPLVVVDTMLIGTDQSAFVITAEGLPTLRGGE